MTQLWPHPPLYLTWETQPLPLGSGHGVFFFLLEEGELKSPWVSTARNSPSSSQNTDQKGSATKGGRLTPSNGPGQKQDKSKDKSRTPQKEHHPAYFTLQGALDTESMYENYSTRLTVHYCKNPDSSSNFRTY
jgi:hypothetical protein